MYKGKVQNKKFKKKLTNEGISRHAWEKIPKMLVFTRGYVCVKAKLTFVSFFFEFFILNLSLRKSTLFPAFEWWWTKGRLQKPQSRNPSVKAPGPGGGGTDIFP